MVQSLEGHLWSRMHTGVSEINDEEPGVLHHVSRGLGVQVGQTTAAGWGTREGVHTHSVDMGPGTGATCGGAHMVHMHTIIPKTSEIPQGAQRTGAQTCKGVGCSRLMGLLSTMIRPSSDVNGAFSTCIHLTCLFIYFIIFHTAR